MKTNPANAEPVERKRIPMSGTRRRMEVPELPGYHLHWFLERNVPFALQGGYEFVKDDEMPLNQFGVATDDTVSGNLDMGTNVSIIGGISAEGKSECQILMKIKEEWWLEDQKAVEARNAAIMSAIFRDERIIGEDKQDSNDRNTSYVKKALFNRPTRK